MGASSVGPSGLKNVTLLSTTAVLSKLKLAGQELTSVSSVDATIEVRLNVDTNKVHSRAKNALVGLEDVEGLSGGDRTMVATAGLELGLDVGDVIDEFSSRAEAVENSLVTNDNSLDHVELVPFLEVGNLLITSVDTTSLNEDTNNHTHAVLGASTTNVLESMAVGRVDAHILETLGGNVGNFRVNIILALALSIVGVRGVGDRPLLAVHRLRRVGRLARLRRLLLRSAWFVRLGRGLGSLDGVVRSGSRLLLLRGVNGVFLSGLLLLRVAWLVRGLGLRGLDRVLSRLVLLRLAWLVGSLGGVLLSRLVLLRLAWLIGSLLRRFFLRGLDGVSRGRSRSDSLVGAGHDLHVLDNGSGDLWMSVLSRRVHLRDTIDGSHSGRGSGGVSANGVSTRSGAHIDSLTNGAVGSAVRGLHRNVWAGDSGGNVDDGGDTSIGVASRSKGGRFSDDNGLGVGQSDRLFGNRVHAGSLAGGDLRSRNGHVWSAGSGHILEASGGPRVRENKCAVSLRVFGRWCLVNGNDRDSGGAAARVDCECQSESIQ